MIDGSLCKNVILCHSESMTCEIPTNCRPLGLDVRAKVLCLFVKHLIMTMNDGPKGTQTKCNGSIVKEKDLNGTKQE